MSAIVLIGRGRLGASLARALSENAFDVHFARPAAGTGIRRAGTVIFCVPDGTIASLAKTLAAEEMEWRGKVVLHTSGLLSSRQLRPLQARGAACGSFHPMQSFPRPNMPAAHFEGVPIGVEGDAAARRAAEKIAQALGARPFTVRAADKPLIHTACSLVSNLYVPLFRMAVGLLESTEIPARRAAEMLIPLVEGTLRNVKQLDASRALSGPISRGDLATVRAQLEVLRRFPAAARIYKVLGREAAALAEEAGLDRKKVKALGRLLGGR